MKLLLGKRLEKAQLLAEQVFDLVATNGQMTAEELALGLGISRATFFRLFGSKEEALIMAVTGTGEQAGAALRAAPPLQPGQTVWHLLRQALEPVILRAERDPTRFRHRITLLRAVPEIRQSAGKARHPRVLAMTSALEERGYDAFSARIYAAAAVAAFENCLSLWVQQESSQSLRSYLDRAFACLDPSGHRPSVSSDAPA